MSQIIMNPVAFTLVNIVSGIPFVSSVTLR
jgi:hypothetical protein